MVQDFILIFIYWETRSSGGIFGEELKVIVQESDDVYYDLQDQLQDELLGSVLNLANFRLCIFLKIFCCLHFASSEYSFQ